MALPLWGERPVYMLVSKREAQLQEFSPLVDLDGDYFKSVVFALFANGAINLSFRGVRPKMFSNHVKHASLFRPVSSDVS